MVFIKINIEINAPTETVWKAISDIRTHVNWMADASKIRITSKHTEGIGVTFDCETRVGPFRTTDKMKITEWTSNELMAISHNGLVSGKGSFILERTSDGKTLFTWEENLNFPFLLGGKITGFFAKPVLRKIWEKNLYKLKQLIEISDKP
jgi:uncharacterized protein YndB with AHSA1/START domain